MTSRIVPKFGFANMRYLRLPFERTFHKDLKTEKSFQMSIQSKDMTF